MGLMYASCFFICKCDGIMSYFSFFLGLLAKFTRKTPGVFLASPVWAFRALLESLPPAGPPNIVLIGVRSAISWPSARIAADDAIFYGTWDDSSILPPSFLTNSLRYPLWIKDSISSFRSKQSFVLWPWSRWYRQYLFLSLRLGVVLMSLGFRSKSKFLIYISICSLDRASGV